MSEQSALIKELEDEYRFAILGLEFPRDLCPDDFNLEQIQEYFETDGESLRAETSVAYTKSIAKDEAEPENDVNIFSPEAADAVGQVRIKILCLHGFQSCGKSLLKQLDGVRAAMPECDFVCPSHAGAWWKASEEGSVYEGWEDSMKMLRRYFKEQGPFDGKAGHSNPIAGLANVWFSIAGLFGFSQGAGLAALIAAMQQYGSDLAPLPRVNFVILYGGFRTRARAHQRFYRAKIQIPALNCIGLQDKTVPRSVSDDLARSFSDSMTVLFDVGHTITKENCEIKQIRNFVLPRFAR
jgi:pimeloyl-ACP methyl ester carboxylesterase